MSPRAPYEHIGRALAEARAAADLTQGDAAHRIGVSPTAYGRWERGVRRPKGRYAARVISALGVDPDLFAEPEVPARPVPPDLEDIFYEMRDRMERLEEMVSLLLTARAADLHVAEAADPAEAFAQAMRQGLLRRRGDRDDERLPPEADRAPGRSRRDPARAAQPSAT